MDLLRRHKKLQGEKLTWRKNIVQILKGDFKMCSYSEFKNELLKNTEVKAEYEALAPEFDIIQALIDARKHQNITQKELSERTGITQADISRIENGTRNPSLAMLKRLAKGIGMQLKVEFIPQMEKK